MRVVFLGNAAWSVPPLEALAASDHPVVLVATREPKPAGRGGRLTPTPVAEAARRLGLPLAEVETVKRGPGFDALALARPDVLAVVAYGEILPQAALDLPSVAPVNLHFSVLPELRGAAPVQRALLEGLTATGVTTMRMDAGMDTGPILLQATEAVDEADDAGSLGRRLAAVGARLLVDTLDRLAAGAVRERPQDAAGATFAPKLGPADRRLDWTVPAEAVRRRVRALSPEPGAATAFRGRNLKVLRASVRTHGPEPGWPKPGTVEPGTVEPGTVEPGTVAFVSKEGFGIAAGDGVVVPEEVAPEGRGRMTGAEFVRGYRPEPGERLGS